MSRNLVTYPPRIGDLRVNLDGTREIYTGDRWEKVRLATEARQRPGRCYNCGAPNKGGSNCVYCGAV